MSNAPRLTAADAAHMLGIGRAQLHTLVDQGMITEYTVNGERRYKRKELHRYSTSTPRPAGRAEVERGGEYAETAMKIMEGREKRTQGDGQ